MAKVAMADASEAIDPRTELDTHANMVVLGKNCFVFDHVQGRTCEVASYNPAMRKAKHVPIVDAAIAYDYPYTLKTYYLLIIRNALYIPTMNNNLIPPFILLKAGLKVRNDVPKIHVESLTVSDHAIEFPEQENGAALRIPLQLWGVFSFFHTRAPTNKEAAELNPLLLTPDSNHWNPHSEHFAKNEESMLDWEGEMQVKCRRLNHVLDFNTAIDYLDVDEYMD